jgi:hypothetical protein
MMRSLAIERSMGGAMSRLFGPIVQLGFVLPDVQPMMEDYLAAGFEPFFLMPPTDLGGSPWRILT